MFRGSIPADLRSLIVEWAKGLPDEARQEMAVTTSGNYSVERAIHGLVPKLHGNDVTIYPCTLGWYLAGDRIPIELKPETREALPWLDSYMDGYAGTAAVVLLGSAQPSFFKAIGRDNAYYRRMLEGVRSQFPRMHAKTVSKLKGLDLRLEQFHPIDVREYVRALPDLPVVSFPPFYGTGDYESQFKPIDEAVEWPKPTYPELDEEGVEELVDGVVDREHWLIGLHVRRERLKPHLRGVVQTTNRGVPIYVYASSGHSRVVAPRQSTEIVPAPRLKRGEELGGRMALAELTLGQFATLRSQYMNVNISPGTPYLAVAVLVDGKVIGSFAVGPSNHHPTTAYMLSDFPVAPTDYPKLSKLIVYAALSRESRLLLQRRCGTQMQRIRTTAFTNRHSSMKYRNAGISPNSMKLEKREDADDGHHRFQLNYIAPFGMWTLPEALEDWKAKHGEREERAA